MGIIEDIIKGNDGHIRGAVVKCPKTNSLIKRPINLLYPIEQKDISSDEQNETEKEIQNKRPPRRAAATIGELRRKFLD